MARRKGYRDPATVRSVVLRMGRDYIDELDAVCDANGRSRREIVETLAREAFQELQENPDARIAPI